MTIQAIIFLVIGGTFLWGGFAQALIRALRNPDGVK